MVRIESHLKFHSDIVANAVLSSAHRRSSVFIYNLMDAYRLDNTCLTLIVLCEEKRMEFISPVVNVESWVP